MSKRRLVGRRLQRVREAIRAEQPLCPDCEAEGTVRGWDELHHIKPLEHGGTDTRENLIGLCIPHHQARTARDRGYRQAAPCDVQGNPVDPGHHWNA